MATIKPFRPISPNALYADQLVFTKAQAESVSGDYTREGGLKPLKILLETGARQRPETPEGQQLAYLDVRETLQSLLEKEQVFQEELPGIYIYEVAHPAYRQTGVWALTDLADYTNGRIKIHELTFADSVRRLKNYREHTALEGSPVLLTYPPCTIINRIISATKATVPGVTLGNPNGGLHRLWKIREAGMQHMLTEAFAKIETVYLADGHHRIESAVKLVKEQQEKGHPAYGSISSLYMCTDQLRIEEYNRVVIPEEPVDKIKLFDQLSKHFYIQESLENCPVQPRKPHRLGMCLAGEWYHLLVKAATYACETGTDHLDAAILQELVLARIFGIQDPKTDSRLKCAGGEKALEEIAAVFQAHPTAVAFTLCPLSIGELISAANEGHILPPKSTWIVPKVPYGLLIHQHVID
jgi:uncharacterized protein (DUF1015 family)